MLADPSNALDPIHSIHYVQDGLYVERIAAAALAKQFGTPLYVYSRAALTAAYRAYINACAKYAKGTKSAKSAEGAKHHANVHYAVKANSNLAILNLFARLGAGFDIVSGGELARVLAAGGQAKQVVFSGIGKSAAEIQAALDAGVKCFNIESTAELHRLNDIAGKMNKKAPIAIRVNPDVDANTHPYISTGLKTSKFGIAFDQARAAYQTAAAMPSVEVVGIDCHIGSQLTDVAPYLDAIDKVLELVTVLAADGIRIHHLDIGGGLGIRYRTESPPAIGTFVSALLDHIEQRENAPREILFEPGRSLVGEAAILLTRVEYLKPGAAKNFAIVDAAINDLIRPMLYHAYHDILPVHQRDEVPCTYDVVGPICESGDWLGQDRTLAIVPGDYLAISSVGAYGFVMSSNYNTRPRAAEVIVDGEQAYLVRERETVEQLFAGEQLLPD